MNEDYSERYLKSLVELGIGRNARAHLKNILFRGDERLKFVCYRHFSKGSLDVASYKNELLQLVRREVEAICNEVFDDCDFDAGKEASNAEREERGGNFKNRSLNYGEIEYKAFLEILRQLEKFGVDPAGKTFYDLGSGTGKALVCARLAADFGKVAGVEVLTTLVEKAAVAVDRFHTRYLEDLVCATPIEQCEGSLMTHKWGDGDVIFCNSTAFDRELMGNMSRKAAACMKKGAIFITFTKALHDYDAKKCFEELERTRMKMSWGPATVIYHRKL